MCVPDGGHARRASEVSNRNITVYGAYGHTGRFASLTPEHPEPAFS